MHVACIMLVGNKCSLLTKLQDQSTNPERAQHWPPYGHKHDRWIIIIINNKAAYGLSGSLGSTQFIRRTQSRSQETREGERQRMRGSRERAGARAKWVVSCLSELHKFLLLKVALEPQIPPDGLNGAFQAAVDQWGPLDQWPLRLEWRDLFA